MLDARDPRKITEVASFVPPAVNNPIQPSQRGVLTNATQVWGVAYDEASALVYAKRHGLGALDPAPHGHREEVVAHHFVG